MVTTIIFGSVLLIIILICSIMMFGLDEIGAGLCLLVGGIVIGGLFFGIANHEHFEENKIIFYEKPKIVLLSKKPNSVKYLIDNDNILAEITEKFETMEEFYNHIGRYGWD